MASPTPPDPAAFFRDMLGQWENAANEFGANLMKSGEFARTVQGATTISLKAQEAAHEAMSRALAAANMPSRGEVADIAARLQGVEERLARIEALLSALAGDRGTAAPAAPARPKPKRTKVPPPRKKPA